MSVRLILNFIEKYKKILFIFSIILLSPFICVMLSEIISFIFNLGRYLGTAFRTFYQILMELVQI